ncbi:MAG: twin-arginine translocation signal domain-containing protein, partial [Acidimicrobiaceae bacterium]|nr:twin-arginine translocation signal domain-containing protein [Acidimicrobiaceae bacterium]
MRDTSQRQPRGAGRTSVSRRRFLEQAGAGAVGLTAFPALWIGRKSAGKAKLSIFVGKDTTYPNEQTAIMSMVQREFQKKHP